MTGEEMRDQLAAALEPVLAGSTLRLAVDRLLPTVRKIAADELREAMREDRTTVAKLTPVEQLTCFLVKGEDLLARADALDPS